MYDRGHGMSQHPGLILKSLFYRFYSDTFSLPQRCSKLKQDELRTQLDVNGVLSAGIALGFMAMLTT